jgi:alpha-L-fucosidase
MKKRCRKPRPIRVPLTGMSWCVPGILAIVLLVSGHAGAADEVPSYLADYEGLYQQDPHAAAVAWFKDAKFGLFVHYALASVLEGGKPEYLKLIADVQEQVELSKLPPSQRATLGIDEAAISPVQKIHSELAQRFRAERFDADAICGLALAAKMRYVNFTTKHLGRMAMYRTATTDFNSVNSPAQRDLVAELAAACRKRGLGLFLYVPPETARTDDDFFELNSEILRELLTQYGPLAGIWFDGIGHYHRNPENYARLSELFALVRQIQPQCLISFKEGALGEEDFVSPEHFLHPTKIDWDTPKRQERWEIRLERWKRQNQALWEKHLAAKPAEINTVMQECQNRDGIGEPGGWINDENARHLDADEVMYLLEMARRLNANLLMNIGPRGDGSIHPDDRHALLEVGRRLRKDGFR